MIRDKLFLEGSINGEYVFIAARFRWIIQSYQTLVMDLMVTKTRRFPVRR